MSLQVLNDNYKQIMTKVVEPMWKYQMKTLFQQNKLDKDDYISLVNLELTKAFKNYDSKKSNIYTFAQNVIKRKCYNEVRNCNRDCRKALAEAISLNAPLDNQDDGTELIFLIEDKVQDEISELTEKRVGEFISNLSNIQLRILLLKLLGFDNDVYAEVLHIPKNRVNDAIKNLKNIETTRSLYKRRFK